MEWYKRFIINIIYWLKCISKTPDFQIERVWVDYVADPPTDIEDVEDVDEFWVDQSYDWTVLDGRFYWDITSEIKAKGSWYLQRLLDTRPSNVTEFVYNVDYYYNDHKYRYVSKSNNFRWPPLKAQGMKFRMPILEAWMCDENKNPKVNVTNKLKKLAGWKGDYHNQEGVLVKDAIMYDYPILCVRTLIGKKYYSENDELLVII